jgi:hypothetical protein
MSNELAKRAIACKHWRWMPGMRCNHRWTGGIRVLADENGEQSESYVVLPDAEGNAVMTIDECGIMGGFPDAGSAYPFLPDLTDPATVGCLLALVREACEPQRAPGDWPMVCTYQSQGKRWGVGAWLNESGKATFAALVLPTYDTEAEALVAALEAAP